MGECRLEGNPRFATEYRLATRADSAKLARKLRKADLAECAAMGVPVAFSALEISRVASDVCFACTINGELVMMVGVEFPVLSDEGAIWALGSDTLYSHPRAMLEEGRRLVKYFQQFYPSFSNWVGADSSHTIRWLKHLGFTVGEPEVRGVKGQLFRKINIGGF